MAFGDASKILAMRRPLYRAAIETEKCAAGVLANGCPAFDSPGPDKLKSAVMLNLWANSGRNALKVRLSPPDKAQSLAQAGAIFRCKVTVHDMAEPPAARQTITLLEFAFDPKKDARPYPLEMNQSFDAPSQFPEWSWRRAPAIRPDAAFKQEVAAFAERLWDAFDRKDLKTVLGMQHVRIRELSQALFKAPDAMTADVNEQLARVVSAPSASLQPLDTDAMVPRLFADDRLVSLADASGNRAITYQLPDNIVSGIPLYMTRGDLGKLVWVR